MLFISRRLEALVGISRSSILRVFIHIHYGVRIRIFPAALIDLSPADILNLCSFHVEEMHDADVC